MNINKTVKYGLLTMAYIAKNSKDGLVKTSSISKEYGIPEMYLTRVTLSLARANLLRSKRGPRGGYTLSRPAQEISMLEIIEILEGSLDKTMEIIQYTKHAPFIVNMETTCKDAVAKAKDILQKTKLSQMIE
jgi:Rrf2 family protein